MRFLRDDRSQAIQIGAVLIFGILIVFLALYQGFVVPNQNEDIEFDHNQKIQNEMTDMRSAVISMPGRTTTQSVSVQLGVRYPSRAIFVNPGPASGTVQTRGTTSEAVNLTVENATADGNVGDFWNGTARSYNTGGIEYRPGYNLFGTAPRTVYEHSVLYNDFGEDTTLSITDQAMVNDDRITLVALNGSFSENRVGNAPIDFEPVSTDTRTVEVYNETHPVTISVPTRMNQSEWEEVFEDELTGNGGHVQSVTTTSIPGSEYAMLELALEAGETYELKLAKVGVGTGATGTTESYLTDVSGNGTTIQEGQTQTLELEVRDEFNNPVSGVTVNGSAENGVFTSSDDSTVTTETGENGQITVEYRGITAGTNDINFTIAPEYEPVAGDEHDAETPENVTITVEVDSPPERDGAGGTAFNVSWLDPSAEPGTDDCDDTSCTLNYTEAQQLELTMETNATADGASVEFAVNDTDVATLSSGTETTDEEGEASVTLNPRDNGTVKVYTWSGGSGDTIEITFTNVTGAFFDVTIDDYDNEVTAGEQVDVDYTIENTGSEEETQDIEFFVDGELEGTETDVELDTDGSFSDTFTYETDEDDVPEITVEVASDDDSDTADVTVEEDDSSQADFVERVGDSTSIGGNDRPQFRFTTESEVNLDVAAIETTGDLEDVGADTGGQRSYFEIDGVESISSDDTAGNFEYEFEPDLTLDEEDGEIFIEFDRLDTQIENLEFVDDEQEADLIISFQFSDGSVKTFYLEADLR